MFLNIISDIDKYMANCMIKRTQISFRAGNTISDISQYSSFAVRASDKNFLLRRVGRFLSDKTLEKCFQSERDFRCLSVYFGIIYTQICD